MLLVLRKAEPIAMASIGSPHRRACAVGLEITSGFHALSPAFLYVSRISVSWAVLLGVVMPGV